MELFVENVLGAGTGAIISMMIMEFVVLVVLSNLIAGPLAYMAMDSWLQNFAIRTEMSPLVFIGSGILVLLIAVLTVGYRTLSTAKLNPVKILRDE